ncbi:MAG: hypothetical protein Q9162_004995 [Coniocarpon cinnabarinum]
MSYKKFNPLEAIKRVVVPGERHHFSGTSASQRLVRDAFFQAGQQFAVDLNKRTEIKARSSTAQTKLPSGLVFMEPKSLVLPNNLKWEQVIEKHDDIFKSTTAELRDAIGGKHAALNKEDEVQVKPLSTKTDPTHMYNVHAGLEAVMRELELHDHFDFEGQRTFKKEEMEHFFKLFPKIGSGDEAGKGDRPDKTLIFKGHAVGPHDVKAPVAIREDKLRLAQVSNLQDAKRKMEGDIPMRAQTAKKGAATSLLDSKDCSETERNLCRQAVKYMIQQQTPFCELYDNHSCALFMVNDLKALKEDYVLYCMILTEKEKSTKSKPVELELNHVRFSTTIWANAVWRSLHGNKWIDEHGNLIKV